MTGGPNHTHPSPDRVLACPGCDTAGQLYRRQDDSVRCHDCGHEFAVGEAIDRPPERGRNLTAELRSKGGGTNQLKRKTIIEAIQDVAEQVGSPSYSMYLEHKDPDDPSIPAILNRFNSWNEAKEACGLKTWGVGKLPPHEESGTPNGDPPPGE